MRGNLEAAFDSGRLAPCSLLSLFLSVCVAVRSDSFARSVKGCAVFTREHLGEFFESAYKTLPVKCRTLENLANFKDLVQPVTRRIPNITTFQAFNITKEGTAIVAKVKNKLHHDDWLGFSTDGKTVGTGAGFRGWHLMRERDVRLEDYFPSDEDDDSEEKEEDDGDIPGGADIGGGGGGGGGDVNSEDDDDGEYPFDSSDDDAEMLSSSCG